MQPWVKLDKCFDSVCAERFNDRPVHCVGRHRICRALWTLPNTGNGALCKLMFVLACVGCEVRMCHAFTSVPVVVFCANPLRIFVRVSHKEVLPIFSEGSFHGSGVDL